MIEITSEEYKIPISYSNFKNAILNGIYTVYLDSGDCIYHKLNLKSLIKRIKEGDERELKSISKIKCLKELLDECLKITSKLEPSLFPEE